MAAIGNDARQWRRSKAAAASLAMHGALIAVALRFTATHVEPPARRSELVPVLIEEPVRQQPTPLASAGASAGPPVAASERPALPALTAHNSATRVGRVARPPAQRRAAALTDARADVVVSYEAPTDSKPGDETSASGSQDSAGFLGVGAGAGTVPLALGARDGLGGLPMPDPPPRPPPAISLARPPAPKYDYLRWGYSGRNAGTVLVELTIDPTGKVRNVRLLQGVDEDTDKRVVKTVRTYEFHPALNAWGEPIWGLHRWEFVLKTGALSSFSFSRRL